jgi:ABC-type multidrug transport system permease subunit
MSRPVVRQLILKDLYLTRWMTISAVAAGLGAVALMPISEVSGYIATVSLICTLVVLNIYLVMGAIAQERKDKVQLFFLSLPVSTTEYTLAKAIANSIAFVVPWAILLVVTLVVIDVSRIPNGVMPFWVAVLVYLLGYYFVLLSVALVSESTGWHAGTIVVGNISVNFLIPFLLTLPSVATNRTGPVAVWTSDIIGIIVLELVVGLVALCVGVYRRSRASDFV